MIRPLHAGLCCVVAIALIVFIPFNSAATAEGDPLAALTEQAKFWHEHGRGELATQALQRVLTANPSHPEAVYLMALYAAQSGDAQEAERWGRKFREVAPDDQIRQRALSQAVRLGASGGASINEARSLAAAGDSEGAILRYRESFGGDEPPENYALEYYQTLAGTKTGWEVARDRLAALATGQASESQASRAYAEVLTYREPTRRQGIAALAAMPASTKVNASLKQALIWLNATPDDKPLFDAYISRHGSDSEVALKLAAVMRPTPVDRAGIARQEGFTQLEEGKAKGAAEQFGTALAINPSDSEALGGLGILLLRQGKYTEAEDKLDEAMKAAPQSRDRWLKAYQSARIANISQQAESARRRGDIVAANRLADELGSLGGSGAANARLLKADILASSRRYAEAEKLYSVVLASDRGNDRARAGLAEALAAQNKTLEADVVLSGFSGKSLEASAQLRQVNARIKSSRAKTQMESGDILSAISTYQDALALAPNDPWLRLDLARALKRKGDTAQARGLFDDTTRGDNATPQMLYAAALFANEDRRPDDAASLIARIPLSKQNADMRKFKTETLSASTLDRAQDALDSGNRAQALALIQQYRSGAAKSNPASRARVAELLFDAGEKAEALAMAQAEMRRGISGKPADYAGFVNVLAETGRTAEAGILMRQLEGKAKTAEDIRAVSNIKTALMVRQADRQRLSGDYAAAFDTLSVAYNADPQNKDTLSALAHLYQSGGKTKQASRIYNYLLDQNPSDNDILSDAAQAAADEGNYERAEDLLSSALQRSPREPKLYLLESRIAETRGRTAEAREALIKARELRRLELGGDDWVANSKGTLPGALGPNPFRSNSSSGGQTRAPLSSAMLFLPASGMSSGGTDDFLALSANGAPGSISPLYGSEDTVPAGDSMMGEIDRRLAELDKEAAPQLKGTVNYRGRSGESGLSRLTEISGEASVAVVPAFGGRFSASATPVSIDAGSLQGDSIKRFGTNPLSAAPPASTDFRKSGVALSVAYQVDDFAIDVGTTPLGFEDKRIIGGVKWAPKISQHSTVSVRLEKRPVTDSVLSYAGVKDKLTGVSWGGISKAGGEIAYSYDQGDSGLYADLGYRKFTGNNVASNTGVTGDAGGYIRPYRKEDAQVQVGVNLHFERFDKNLRYFTFGHGGYFSPQQFVSLAFPVSYEDKTGKWSYKLEAAPGIQSFSEDEAPYFPNDDSLQQELITRAARDSDVITTYSGTSNTGGGFYGNAKAEYAFTPTTSVGGSVGFNSFGDYSETKAMFYLKQMLEN